MARVLSIDNLSGFGQFLVKFPAGDYTTAAAKCSEDRPRQDLSSSYENGARTGRRMTEKAVWHMVKDSAKRIGLEKPAPHDLRRTRARLCHSAGRELEQIQFLLGHVSIQTTEHFPGCEQRIRSAMNDRIGIEPCL